MTVIYNKDSGQLLVTLPYEYQSDTNVGLLNVTVPEGKVLSGISIDKGEAVAVFADIPIDPKVSELHEKIGAQEKELTNLQLAVAELYEGIAK